jgi:DNA-binding MarR family transcriptional regulator
MVGELAEAMGVTASTMSLNLKRLQEGGFVTRSRDPEDRRVMNVVLTERGRRLRDAQSILDPDRVHAMLALMRPDERRRALEGVALLADAADRMVARRGAHAGALAGGTDERPRLEGAEARSQDGGGVA